MLGSYLSVMTMISYDWLSKGEEKATIISSHRRQLPSEDAENAMFEPSFSTDVVQRGKSDGKTQLPGDPSISLDPSCGVSRWGTHGGEHVRHSSRVLRSEAQPCFDSGFWAPRARNAEQERPGGSVTARIWGRGGWEGGPIRHCR